MTWILVCNVRNFRDLCYAALNLENWRDGAYMAFDVRNHWGLGGLLLGSVAAMICTTAVDYPLTKWIWQNGWTTFAESMGQSLFEGEYPGGGDLAVIFLVVVFGCYALSLRPQAPTGLAAWRPSLGFMVAGSLITAFAWVHTLKWLVVRARPYLVFDGSLPFTAWYEIGPHFINEGIYYGSFTSGHTAQVFVMMTLAYALVGRGRKPAGWVVGTGVLTYTLTMGLARCMTLSHWVTDVIGAVVISWRTLHVLYYQILKVPLQHRHRDALTGSGNLKAGWELLLGLSLVATCLGLVLAGLGLRAFWIPEARQLAFLILPGIPLAVWGALKSRQYCRRLNQALAEAPTGSLTE